MTVEAISALGAVLTALVGSVGLNLRQYMKAKTEAHSVQLPLEQAAAAQWQDWAGRQLAAAAERHEREELMWNAERQSLLLRITTLEETVQGLAGLPAKVADLERLNDGLGRAIERLTKRTTPPPEN